MDLLQLVWHMTGAAVVGALGGPWRWEWHEGGAWADTPTPLVALALLVVAAVAVLAVLRRRRAGWAWLLLAGYLGLQIVLVATSRAPVFGAEIGLAYRLQTDLVCVLALCLGLAFVPLLGARQSRATRGGAGPGRAGPAGLPGRSPRPGWPAPSCWWPCPA